MSGTIGVSLTYNSLDSRDSGLGAGWTLVGGPDDQAAPQKLIDHGARHEYDAAEVVYPDGGSRFYTHVGRSDVYRSQPGDTSTLKKSGSGWTLTLADGGLYTFTATNGNGTTLVSSAERASADPGEGTISYSFAQGGSELLSGLSDPAGRTITLTWNTLNPSGCPNALVCVTGPDGITWTYTGASGGGTGGPLAGVNDQTRDLYQLTYNEDGRLQTIRNANDLDPTHASPGYDDQHSVTVGYDGSARVDTISEGPISGQTPPISVWAFAYHPGAATTEAPVHDHEGAPAALARSADGYTQITPPRQQSEQDPAATTVYYDELDHPIETVDLLGHTTLAGYNQKDELLWAEDADGNPTDYQYDPVTNLLLSVSKPAPDGEGEQTRPRPDTGMTSSESATPTPPARPRRGCRPATTRTPTSAAAPPPRKPTGG